jgi:hypothetical protein
MIGVAVVLAVIVLIFSHSHKAGGLHPVAAISVGVLFTVIVLFKGKTYLGKFIALAILWIGIAASMLNL